MTYVLHVLLTDGREIELHGAGEKVYKRIQEVGFTNASGAESACFMTDQLAGYYWMSVKDEADKDIPQVVKDFEAAMGLHRQNALGYGAAAE